MPKKKPKIKRNRSGSSIASRKPKPKKAAQAKATLKERLDRAKKLARGASGGMGSFLACSVISVSLGTGALHHLMLLL